MNRLQVGPVELEHQDRETMVVDLDIHMRHSEVPQPLMTSCATQQVVVEPVVQEFQEKAEAVVSTTKSLVQTYRLRELLTVEEDY